MIKEEDVPKTGSISFLLLKLHNFSRILETTKPLPPRSNGKPEAATAVYKLLMMGMKMSETC
jgi:hypothetical protein